MTENRKMDILRQLSYNEQNFTDDENTIYYKAVMSIRWSTTLKQELLSLYKKYC